MSVWGHVYVNFVSESRQCMSKGLQDRDILILHWFSKLSFSKAYISRSVGICVTDLMSLWGNAYVIVMSESRQCKSKGLEDTDLLILPRLFESQLFKGTYLAICRNLRDKTHGNMRRRECHRRVRVTSIKVQGFGGFKILIFLGYSKVHFSKARISRSVGIWATCLMSLRGNVYVIVVSESSQCKCKVLEDSKLLIFRGYSKVNF
jgi:hypothetical protein